MKSIPISKIDALIAELNRQSESWTARAVDDRDIQQRIFYSLRTLEDLKKESEEMIPLSEVKTMMSKKDVEGLLVYYEWALRQKNQKRSLKEIQTELKKHWIPLSTVEALIEKAEQQMPETKSDQWNSWDVATCNLIYHLKSLLPAADKKKELTKD